jgi:hypothetical protein
MNSQKFLLPIYYVQKKSKKSLNEKNLIIILLIASVLSIFFILKNLPTHVNFSDDSRDINVKNLFLPKFNQSNHNHKFIHDEVKHQHDLPNIPNVNKQENDKSNSNDKEKGNKPEPDELNKKRREKIKNVCVYFIKFKSINA